MSETAVQTLERTVGVQLPLREVYLDHNATTPVDPEVVEAMLPFLGKEFANPSSVHAAGRRARKAVENAREQVAELIGADPKEIIFTSGGTEANNLAVLGSTIMKGLKHGHIVTSQIEHPCIMGVTRYLSEMGFEVSYVPVDRHCRVDPEAVKEAIRKETVLVSIMLANNETGTVQPVQQIGAIARQRGIPFHVDAVQAVAKIPVNVDALNADLLTISAHKFYGPKGIGALYVRDGIKLGALLRGHQERGLRAGTENVAGIVGMGKAAQIGRLGSDRTVAHLKRLRLQLLRLRHEVPFTRVNGHQEHTLPSTVNFCFLYADAMPLLANLSQRGIYISVGSACASGSLLPSYVLKAMGLSDEAAYCSVRFSLGKGNTEEDIEYVVQQVKEVVEILRLIKSPEEIGICDENCPCFWEGTG